MVFVRSRMPLIFTLLLIGGLAACGEGGGGGTHPFTVQDTPTPLATRTPMPGPVVAGQLLPQPGTIYFGAFVNPSGLVGGNTPQATADFETQLNRPLTLHMQYEAFTGNLSNSALHDDFANYRIPIVSWNCGVSNAQIASGAYDPTIKLKADEARNYGWPVFLRYQWDVNLPFTVMSRSSCYDRANDEPDNLFSPAQFIAAWDHIRTIFAQEGATNVVWIWSVSSLGTDPLQYYPGDSEVDWIGIDAYDIANNNFAQTFSPIYTEIAPLNKPVMITETGAPGPLQTAFFSGAANTLKTQFPKVRGFVYYDGLSYISIQNQDWRITPSSLPSFSTFANDPYLQGHYAL
jgi:hypothetical protein